MEVIEAINTRFTEREFTNQPVAREQITELMTAAQQAPCSCNLQLMHYVVVDDKSLQDKLANIATRKVLWAPVNIFFFLDPRFTVHRHSAVMGLGASMQNISLTALSMGLGTCPMAGFRGDKELKQLLNVPDFLEPILIMGVGHPKKSVVEKKRDRLPVEDITHFNQFADKANFINESDDLRNWSISDLINYRKRIGPVYRYGNRFNLQVFHDLAYEKAAELFSQKISSPDGRILDLFTYDSRFVKALKDLDVPDKITISDYFPDVSQGINEIYSDISYVNIGIDNEISAKDESFDAITLIHKLTFTPDLQSLFRETVRVLKPEGHVLVTFENMSVAKRLVYFLRRFFIKYASFRSYNVYEANPYYKIGPHRTMSLQSLKRVCKKSGLTLIEYGVVDLPTQARFKSSVAYAIFKK